MVCQVQWQGYEAAFALGLRSDDGQWEDAEEVFETGTQIWRLYEAFMVSFRELYM